jgi:hypothetical protein
MKDEECLMTDESHFKEVRKDKKEMKDEKWSQIMKLEERIKKVFNKRVFRLHFFADGFPLKISLLSKSPDSLPFSGFLLYLFLFISKTEVFFHL